MAKNRLLEESVEVADNPEPRCPCVLLLDTSGSMKGERLEALSRGLETFRTTLLDDPLATRRVEIAVVTFDSRVRVVQDFVSPDVFEVPALAASGNTHMAGGIERALEMIRLRKSFYKRQGLAYYRPWVFMITDGRPEGESDSAVAEASARLRTCEREKAVAFFAVGVADADVAALRKIVVRKPLLLRELAFDELFIWLSASMQAVSRSQPGDKVQLPAMGWLKHVADFMKTHKEFIEHSAAIIRVAAKVTIGV